MRQHSGAIVCKTPPSRFVKCDLDILSDIALKESAHLTEVIEPVRIFNTRRNSCSYNGEVTMGVVYKVCTTLTKC